MSSSFVAERAEKLTPLSSSITLVNSNTWLPPMSHALLSGNPGLAAARADFDRAVAKLMNRPIPSTSAFTLDDSVSQFADESSSSDGDDDYSIADDDEFEDDQDDAEETLYERDAEDLDQHFDRALQFAGFTRHDDDSALEADRAGVPRSMRAPRWSSDDEDKVTSLAMPLRIVEA